MLLGIIWFLYIVDIEEYLGLSFILIVKFKMCWDKMVFWNEFVLSIEEIIKLIGISYILIIIE